MPNMRANKRRQPSIDSEVSTGSTNKKVRKVINNGKTAEPIPEVKHLSLSYTKPGVVLAFGTGDVGQLGMGEDIMEKLRPALVPDLDNVVNIVAGGMHNVCLTSSGDVISWGCNDEGALGREATEAECFEPKKVELPKPAVMITAGDSHSAALLEDGRVFVWGSFRDASGNMGLIHVDVIEKKPVQVLPEIFATKIASGADHLIVLSDKDQIYTFGCGQQGQLGRLSLRETNRDRRQGIASSLNPELLTVGLKKKLHFTNIWAGTWGTFLLDNNSDIYVCGLNNYYQIGLPKEESYYRPTKSNILKNKKITKICGGLHHTLVLNEDGKVFCLGRKEYGRLGLGKECEDATQLVEIPALSNLKCVDIACGGTTSFAVTDSGDLYAWGMGTSGALGTGDEEDVYTPQLIKGKQLQERFVLQVAGGGQHTIVLAKTKNNNTNSDS